MRERIPPGGDESTALGPVSGHFGGQDDGGAAVAIGALIHDLRCARGWSQGRLAAELCAVSGHPTITRENISRWEHGRRGPGPFWLGYLAAALQVPLAELEREIVKRREMLKIAGTVAAAAVAGPATAATGADMWAAIAAGDPGPLATVQTSHQTDLLLARLAAADRPAVLHMARWMDDGGSAVLRVNAAGILAKTPDLDLAGQAAALLRRDTEVRMRYLRAVSARVGTEVRALTAELSSPRDAGARWCCAWLLGHDGTPAARQALVRALRAEPVTENVRTIGMILSGDDPCT